MQSISRYFNAILVAVLAFTLLAFGWPSGRARAATPTPAPQEAQLACDSSRSVQVSGTAVVNVVPDRVLIQLGVQSNGSTVAEVQKSNSAAIQKVIQALHAQGIPDKDIATDWYVIDPLYDDYDSLYIKGYRINNLVGVTLRDVGKTSSLIAAALQAGANQVVNVEFYTSELRKYRDQARALAMQAASEKAAALAGAAGAKVGCVVNISENSWSYYNGGWGGGNASLWTQNAVQNAAPSGSGGAAAGDDGPVSLGQISVQAQVAVTYSLK
jgi:uncharacterized protein